jgi:hypothetical protein
MNKKEEAEKIIIRMMELERQVKILELEKDNWKAQAVELGRTVITRNFQISCLQKDSKVKFK